MNPRNLGSTPPRWATRLLHGLAHPDTREEVEGDLLELYNHWTTTLGARRANWRYCLSVLRLLRPFATPNPVPEYSTPFFFHPDMLSNYFKIAWRNLVQNKVYSAINISGLAVGMAVAMLIGLWLYDELSVNKSFQHYDRVAQLLRNRTVNGETDTKMGLPIPLAQSLKASYGESFKHVELAWWTSEHTITRTNQVFSKSGKFMTPGAPICCR